MTVAGHASYTRFRTAPSGVPEQGLGLIPGFGLIVLILLLFAAPALAHKPSDSYLRISGGEGKPLAVQWDIALKDLNFLVGLDVNQDSQITWGEVKARRQAITAHALSHLSISADGEPVKLRVTDLLINEHSDGNYATLAIQTDAPGDAEVLTIQYSLLFNADPTHRGLVLYQNKARGLSSTYVLSPGDATLTLRTGKTSVWYALLDYVRTGIWHIWVGFDHVLFLLCLLLPAVLVPREKTWQPVGAFRPACMAVLKIVTMFTLAHSITLWLAVTGWIALPGRLVQGAVALSIVVTALNNLTPKWHIRGGYIAFGFGLIHGFGFANVLTDLGVSGWTLAVALLGFNSGVEVGQMVIVLLFFPLAYMLRHTAFYRWGILRLGSVIIAIVAAIWMVGRILNVKLLGV